MWRTRYGQGAVLNVPCTMFLFPQISGTVKTVPYVFMQILCCCLLIILLQTIDRGRELCYPVRVPMAETKICPCVRRTERDLYGGRVPRPCAVVAHPFRAAPLNSCQ